MTKTLISSDKQEITIGFEAPFCVIGERINPTGRKLLAAEMAAGDYSRVIADAVAQVEAGATMTIITHFLMRLLFFSSFLTTFLYVLAFMLSFTLQYYH